MLKVDETPVPSSAQSHLRLDWSNVCTLLLRVHLPVLETRMTNKQKIEQTFPIAPPCSDTLYF